MVINRKEIGFFFLLLFLSLPLPMITFAGHSSPLNVKVAVFDGPLNLEAFRANGGVLCEGHDPYVSNRSSDAIVEHGTNIALTAGVNNPSVCVMVIKAFIPYSNKEGWLYSPDYLDLKLVDADIYNFSLAGSKFSLAEKRYILKALKAGKKVVVAAGNCENLDIKPPCNEAVYPAEYVFSAEFKEYVKSGMFVVVRPDTERRNTRYDEVAKVRPYCSTFNGKTLCGSSIAAAHYSGEGLF